MYPPRFSYRVLVDITAGRATAYAPDALSRRVRSAQLAAGEGDASEAWSGSNEASRSVGPPTATRDAQRRGDELGAATEARVRSRDRMLRALRREAQDHCQHRRASGHRAHPCASGQDSRGGGAVAVSAWGAGAACAAAAALNSMCMKPACRNPKQAGRAGLRCLSEGWGISGRLRTPGNDHQGICIAGRAIHAPDCWFRPAGARLRLDIRHGRRSWLRGRGPLNFLSARSAPIPQFGGLSVVEFAH